MKNETKNSQDLPEVDVEKKTEPILEKKELSLEEKLELSIKEKEEMKDKWLRGVAEFDNFRKRSIAEKSSWIKNATQGLVLDLCDVMDNFERALITEANDHQKENFKKGIDMIYKQIESLLKKKGVEKMEALGKDFDPEFHEAMANIPSDLEENKIAAIIQNGYFMNDKLIRPVRVAVSNGEKSQKLDTTKEIKNN